jgi:hypothetical protein
MVCGTSNPISRNGCSSCHFIKGATKQSAEVGRQARNESPGPLAVIIVLVMLGVMFLLFVWNILNASCLICK